MLDMFTSVLLGVGLGAVAIIPPGPVTMSLIQVGVQRRARTGAGAGVAVAAADATLALVALGVIALGAATRPGIAAATTVIGVVTMLVAGLVLALRPAAVEQVVGTIERPVLTLFGITLIAPTTLLGWIALLGAVPVSTTADRVAIALGVMAFSAIWHPLLGLTAGRIGERASARMIRGTTRAGGVALCALALGFAVL